MVGRYSIAYQSSSDSSCKFSDTVANVPEHTLTAKPVDSIHQVCILILQCSLIVLIIVDVQKVSSKDTKVRR